MHHSHQIMHLTEHFQMKLLFSGSFTLISLIKIRSIDTLTKIATQGDPIVAIFMRGPKDLILTRLHVHVYSQVIRTAHGPFLTEASLIMITVIMITFDPALSKVTRNQSLIGN